MNSTDLSGQWSGEYSYPAHAGPITPFLAIIEDHGGHLSGTIIEPNTLEGGTAEAYIAGTHNGSSVDFIKTYAPGASPAFCNPVDYVGKIEDDGQVVRGVWSLLDMDGTFEMRRELSREEMLERQMSEKEPVGPNR